MNTLVRESRLAGYLSLFASLSTLVCCALPSLLVVVGFGATLASFLSAVPWLVALSRQKAWVFAASGALIAANGYYLYRVGPARLAKRVCPPGEADACAAAHRFSRAMLFLSAGFYSIGFLIAYALGPILGALDR